MISTNMLSANKVKLHGMTSTKWTTKDKITQYKGLINLYTRDKKIIELDTLIAQKKQTKELKGIQREIEQNRKDLENAVQGDKQKLRNTLAEHREMQLAFQNSQPQKVIDMVHQVNFTKRKTRDILKYRMKLKSDRLIDLKLRYALYEDRLKYDGQSWLTMLPCERTAHLITGKVNAAILRKEAAIYIRNAYKEMIAIMKKDALYFDAILVSIRNDGLNQGKCMINATKLGQLGAEYLDDRRQDFRFLEKVVKQDMVVRKRDLAEVRHNVEQFAENLKFLLRRDYLMNRKGTCDIQIQYQDENSKKSVVKQIEFKTMEGSEDEDSEKSKCPSADTDPVSNCAPVDCVIKYSGEQSFFNMASNECEAVPECCYDPQNSLPDTGYSISNNSCIDLNCSITTHDLHLLENNQAYVAEAVDVLPANKICHHGDVTDEGTCQCWFGWETSTNENEMYEPTVLQYHMCNIEKGSWNSMNRGKIKATGLIITIFCLTVISKFLILLCVLSFCYKQYKARRQCECLHGDDGDMLKEILVCERSPCDECICKDVFDNTIRSKTTLQGDGYMGRSNSRKSIEFYPGGMVDDANLFGDRSKSEQEIILPGSEESVIERSKSDLGGMRPRSYESSGQRRSSATDSAEISFPTDTDETTQVSTDMDGEEEEYEVSTSCRCYEHEEGVCTCDDDSEDYTPSVHPSKTPTSKSKTSTS